MADFAAFGREGLGKFGAVAAVGNGFDTLACLFNLHQDLAVLIINNLAFAAFVARVFADFQRRLAVNIRNRVNQFAFFMVGKIGQLAFGRIPNGAPFGAFGIKVGRIGVFAHGNGIDLFGFAVLIKILNHGCAVFGVAEQHAVIAAGLRAVGTFTVGAVVGDDLVGGRRFGNLRRFVVAHGLLDRRNGAGNVFGGSLQRQRGSGGKCRQHQQFFHGFLVYGGLGKQSGFQAAGFANGYK